MGDRPIQPRPSGISIRDMAEKCNTLIGSAALTDWEIMFLEGACFAVLVKEERLSDKQVASMQEIYLRYFNV